MNLKEIVSRWSDPVQNIPWKEPVIEDVEAPIKASPVWVDVIITLPTPEEAREQIKEKGFAEATLRLVDKPIAMKIALTNVLLAKFPKHGAIARFKACVSQDSIEIGELVAT